MTPMVPARSAALSASIFLPKIEMVPVSVLPSYDCGPSLPKKRCANTDLPHATGPVMPVIVPGWQVHETLLNRGGLSLKENETLCISAIGVVVSRCKENWFEDCIIVLLSEACERYGFIRFQETVAF